VCSFDIMGLGTESLCAERGMTMGSLNRGADGVVWEFSYWPEVAAGLPGVPITVDQMPDAHHDKQQVSTLGALNFGGLKRATAGGHPASGGRRMSTTLDDLELLDGNTSAAPNATTANFLSNNDVFTAPPQNDNVG